MRDILRWTLGWLGSALAIESAGPAVRAATDGLEIRAGEETPVDLRAAAVPGPVIKGAEEL